MSEVACIDLFCGAGGLTHGLTRAGVPVVAGIDVDAACRYPFESNNSAGFIAKDVKDVKPSELKSLYGDAEIRILAGCAPCQPFSAYSQRYDTLTSPRWPLLYQFARLIRSVRPDVVTMENVPLVEKHAVFDDFVATLRRLGYKVWQDVVDCTQYGLPQTRRRMVILASAIGPIELIAPTHDKPRTVKDAIGMLSFAES
jgi:DNA (cytosine-5)-methyltransferase 1